MELNRLIKEENIKKKNYYLITILGIIILIITFLIAIQIILGETPAVFENDFALRFYNSNYISILVIISFIISLVWLPTFYLNFKRLNKPEMILNLMILILVLSIFLIIHYNIFRLFINMF